MRKIPLLNSLAGRITAVVLTSISVALIVFTLSLTAFDRASSVSQLDGRLTTIADIAGQNSTAALDFRDKDAADQILQALQRESHVVSACLYDASGLLFSEYRRDSYDAPCAERVERTLSEQQGYRRVQRGVLRKGDLVGTICLTSDMRDVAERERRMLLLAILLALVALVIGGVSGSVMQMRITGPIKSLHHVIHDVVTSESFKARAPVAGSKEIADLASAFNRMLEELEHRDEATHQAEANLHSQARTDALTGLPNRRLFTESLSQAVAFARRTHRNLGLLYIDLDGFKHVNDSLGHSVGDQLLCEVGKRLSTRVRRSDMLARVGGDEFTVILRSVEQMDDATAAAESLIQGLTHSFRIEGREISIGASIGISTLDESLIDAAELLKQADSAMYAAKRAGRNRAVHFSSDLGNLARERHALESELRGAIGRGEIYVQYQPEFDLISGQLVRFEALARWKHPMLGEISPVRFIAIAEESGLIHEIGKYVMEQACREAVVWQELSEQPIQVAVNVSAVEFHSESAVEEIIALLERTGLSPDLLQIELTESVMMGPVHRAADKLYKLRDYGVNLALDDFGTGYSCLSYLSDLPFHSIKIDRSFVRKLPGTSESLILVNSLIGLAHNMQMRVIVEGIETPKQLELLHDMGADEAQGFLLGRPDGKPRERLQPLQHVPWHTALPSIMRRT